MRSPAFRLLRRALAALLLIVFPAMTAAMGLPGTGAGSHSEAAQGHAHAGHNGGSPHAPTHHQCCDLCGGACGCSIHVGLAGFSAPATVAAAGSAIPPRARAVRRDRVPHLLPPPLGPPAPLA